MDEIKVRWKKAALENCLGVPCAFVCGTSSVLDIDGNSYETVAIVGTAFTQCWTKTNLKVTKYNDGTVIPDLTTSASNPWAPTSGARTGYDVSVVPLSDYVGTYGYLYNWNAVNDTRKLCPIGWHVPTDAEWTALTSQLGGVGMAGTVMKSTSSLWNVATPPSPGTNTSDFSALPAGFRNGSGTFANIRINAIFWSATVRSGTEAWYRHLFDNNGNVARYAAGLDFTYGASVRCLRD